MIQPLHPISPIFHQSLLCKDAEVFENMSGENIPKHSKIIKRTFKQQLQFRLQLYCNISQFVNIKTNTIFFPPPLSLRSICRKLQQCTLSTPKDQCSGTAEAVKNRFSIIPLLAVLNMRKRESYRHTLPSCLTLYFWLRGTVIYLQNLTANLLAS